MRTHFPKVKISPVRLSILLWLVGFWVVFGWMAVNVLHG